jgi:hypothetical protein
MGPAELDAHERRKAALLETWRDGRGGDAPLGLAKRTSNLVRDRSTVRKQPLDLSPFCHVLQLDTAAGWVDVEGLVSYETLVDATRPLGVMPAVVPQLKTITVAGAVAGVGIEATSFRHGLVHDTLLALDVPLPGGEVLHCAPHNHVDIPLAQAGEFLDFLQREIGIWPIWICPIRAASVAGQFPLYPLRADTRYVNFGFWDVVESDRALQPGHFNRLVERKVIALGGIKSLYSDSYFSREEFDAAFGMSLYPELKAKYDPQQRLLGLYEKCVLRAGRHGRRPRAGRQTLGVEAGLVGLVQPVLQPVTDQRRGVRQLQLFQDAALVRAHRLHRQVQRRGNLARALAGDDALQHLELAVRQLRVARRTRRAVELLHHALGQAGRDVGAACGHLAHGRHQLGRGAVLGDIAVGPGAEGAQRVLLLGVHAQHQHRHAGMFGPDAPYQLQPAHARHRQIDDGQAKRRAAQAFQRLEAAAGLGDLPFVGHRLEDAPQALAHDGVVIDEQQPVQAGACVDGRRRAHRPGSWRDAAASARSGRRTVMRPPPLRALPICNSPPSM